MFCPTPKFIRGGDGNDPPERTPELPLKSPPPNSTLEQTKPFALCNVADRDDTVFCTLKRPLSLRGNRGRALTRPSACFSQGRLTYHARHPGTPWRPVTS
jgi:hypothetical protein